MDGLTGFMDSFSNDWICENCGKHFTEDYRASNTINNGDKRIDKIPHFCSIQCNMNYRHKDLWNALDQWKQGKDVSSQMSITKGIRVGELLSFFVREIKSFLYEEQQHKCFICGCPDVWNGQKLTFILDHIDGVYTNQLKSNLRLIWPNCNSQLDTTKRRSGLPGRRSHKYDYYVMKDRMNNPIGVLTQKDWEARLELLSHYNKNKHGWIAQATRDTGLSKAIIVSTCKRFGIVYNKKTSSSNKEK